MGGLTVVQFLSYASLVIGVLVSGGALYSRWKAPSEKIKDTVDTLQNNVEDVQKDISGLKDNVSNDMAELKKQLTKLQASHEEFSKLRVDERFSKHEERLCVLEDQNRLVLKGIYALLKSDSTIKDEVDKEISNQLFKIPR